MGFFSDAGAGSPDVAACRARVLRLGFHAGFRAELSRLDVPTLVVHGTGDVNSPVEMTGRRKAALVPKAQHKEYDNAAHGLFMTHAKPDPGRR
jgi:pimeloyl-ACP methyl ester carboxylesterase